MFIKFMFIKFLVMKFLVMKFLVIKFLVMKFLVMKFLFMKFMFMKNVSAYRFTGNYFYRLLFFKNCKALREKRLVDISFAFLRILLIQQQYLRKGKDLRFTGIVVIMCRGIIHPFLNLFLKTSLQESKMRQSLFLCRRITQLGDLSASFAFLAALRKGNLKLLLLNLY